MGVKVTFLDSSGHDEPSTSSGGPPPRPAARVPASAIARDGETRFLWRVRGDRVERVAVRVGAERAGQVEVLAGINPGDVVVATPVGELSEGAVVAANERNER
jgi:hypothetical protein